MEEALLGNSKVLKSIASVNALEVFLNLSLTSHLPNCYKMFENPDLRNDAVTFKLRSFKLRIPGPAITIEILLAGVFKLLLKMCCVHWQELFGRRLIDWLIKTMAEVWRVEERWNGGESCFWADEGEMGRNSLIGEWGRISRADLCRILSSLLRIWWTPNRGPTVWTLNRGLLRLACSK